MDQQPHDLGYNTVGADLSVIENDLEAVKEDIKSRELGR
jgi:hypothetical protein